MASLIVGEVVDGYTLEERLGIGGFGEVWKVISKTKKVKVWKFPKNGSMKELLKEAKAHSRLEHPGILEIENIVEGENARLEMPFFDGKDLRKKNNYSHDEKIDVLKQVADSLSYAHEQGVVHRDLKPENILVNKELVVKVLDFGASRLSEGYESVLLSEHLATSGISGTLSYMSPEQMNNQEAKPTDDVYSLSLLMFELFAERPLGMREDSAKAIQESEIDENLGEIIQKGLELNPDDRYQTMEEFSQALDSIAGQSVTVPAKEEIVVRVEELLDEYHKLVEEYDIDDATSFARMSIDQMQRHGAFGSDYVIGLMRAINTHTDDLEDPEAFGESVNYLLKHINSSYKGTLPSVEHIEEMMGKSSPTPQFKSINSSVLSFLHSPTFTSIHDNWKNDSLD